MWLQRYRRGNVVILRFYLLCFWPITIRIKILLHTTNAQIHSSHDVWSQNSILTLRWRDWRRSVQADTKRRNLVCVISRQCPEISFRNCQIRVSQSLRIRWRVGWAHQTLRWREQRVEMWRFKQRNSTFGQKSCPGFLHCPGFRAWGYQLWTLDPAPQPTQFCVG